MELCRVHEGLEAAQLELAELDQSRSPFLFRAAPDRPPWAFAEALRLTFGFLQDLVECLVADRPFDLAAVDDALPLLERRRLLGLLG